MCSGYEFFGLGVLEHRPNLCPFVRQEAEPWSLCSAGGRTFVPLFGRRPNLLFVVQGRRPRYDSRHRLAIARPEQEVPTEASLRHLRQEAEVRLATLRSRRQAGTGGSGRTIVTSSEVLRRAKAFAMLGALAWQARSEQAVPAEPLLFRPRCFAKVDNSFFRPRHVAEVQTF